jgi:bifunctional isochorismate lyase/aryl carrier protein
MSTDHLPVPTTLDELRVLVAAMLGEPPAELGDEDDLLLDWGLDSMRVMGLVEDLVAQGLELRMVELAERPTLAAWHALISDRARTAAT